MSEKTWRWGYWTHRPDQVRKSRIGMDHYPVYEFTKDGSVEDGLCLASCEYGTLAESPDQQDEMSVLCSNSTGYGGESSVFVRDEDAELIADAPKLLAEVRRLRTAIQKFDDASRCEEGGRVWCFDAEMAADELLKMIQE